MVTVVAMVSDSVGTDPLRTTEICALVAVRAGTMQLGAVDPDSVIPALDRYHWNESGRTNPSLLCNTTPELEHRGGLRGSDVQIRSKKNYSQRGWEPLL